MSGSSQRLNDGRFGQDRPLVVGRGVLGLALLMSGLMASPLAAQPPRPLDVDLSGPPEIPAFDFGRSLTTVAINKASPFYTRNLTFCYDPTGSPQPKVVDQDGSFILSFAYKPVRIIDVNVPGRGRREIFYLYYRVINQTGEPRLFVPEFVLATNDTGQVLRNSIIPEAVAVINRREDDLLRAGKPLQAYSVGMIPPSENANGFRAYYGVALFEGVDPNTDDFSIYITGLSDFHIAPEGQELAPFDPLEDRTRYKTLRLDFLMRGDEFDLTEREVQQAVPAYEWVYWNKADLATNAPQ